MTARRLLLLLALALVSAGSEADWQTRSWSRWELGDEGAEAVFGIERIELQRLSLPDEGSWLSAALRQSVEFSVNHSACGLDAAEPVAAPPSLLLVRLRFHCDGVVDAPMVKVRLLHDAVAQPLHYVSVVYRGHTSEALLTPSKNAFSPACEGETPGRMSVLRDYAALGFVHILEGLDHVAFLLCLLLATPGFAKRVWMVTGFTLGHSATLSLSALGLLRVETGGVEALIGFTVALLAAETWQRSNGGHAATLILGAVTAALAVAGLAGVHVRLPVLASVALLALAPAYLRLARRSRDAQLLHFGIVAVFGLVHGLGFASALNSIGLPEGRRGWALAGFNAGVEAGQLALLLVAGTCIAMVLRMTGSRQADAVATALSGGLFATGVFWLVQRAA